MSDTLTISDSDLDEMLAEVLPCDTCHGPAEFMSRGHRCRPPGFRIFRCEKCYLAWRVQTEANFALGSKHIHTLCQQPVASVDDLSLYHPI
jgi:hypothetical protein